MTGPASGVSFVVPVHGGRKWLRAVLAGIAAQADGRPFEVIVVLDGETDATRRVVNGCGSGPNVRVVDGPARGAAAAINAGIREAAHPIVCQIDQDVVLEPGWLAAVLAEFDSSDIAAAQGHYTTSPGAGFWARCMGRDLEQRYAAIRGRFVNHVCTGNTAYRASALHQIGLLDEALGYGYDNDLSYRLTAAGYRLAFSRAARSVHFWREDFAGYLRQQFGVGYGRLDVVARHPRHVGGDDVSGALMMLHAPGTLAAMVAISGGAALLPLGLPASPLVAAGAVALALLALERTVAGYRAWRVSRDPATLGFPVVHALRDCAWAAAIVAWGARRLAGTPARPGDSMRRFEAPSSGARVHVHAAGRVLAIVPAFNEAQNLRRVVAGLRRSAPELEVLIVNDGSTDETDSLLPELGVRWLRLSQRIGVGGAVRAGLRYARSQGFTTVVRLDGDAQHRPCDIPLLLAPIAAGQLDAVLGSRFLGRRGRRLTGRRVIQLALARSVSAMTGRRITDATSGFWVFGPRAVSLLGRHHPPGYAEPELLLFLCRNGLRVGERPIRIRPRIAGRTTLTPWRAALASVRTLLAMLMVPVRGAVEGHGRE